jgi:two-component system, OmpR family, KDP operon response regulator KdpE
MSDQPQILVIDDEQQILRALRTIIGQQNYRVIGVSSGEEGLAMATAIQPDVIILDLGLPDISGVEVCQKLRLWTDIPIIILSAHDSQQEKVAALDAGADDYLTKPFGADELLARVRVALRRRARNQGARTSIVTTGDLSIDLANHMVTRDGIMVKLTSIEYKLLSYLAANAGRVLTHQAILNHVWGLYESEQMEYLRVYIRQLRQKLEQDPHHPQVILTESGVGYRFITSG